MMRKVFPAFLLLALIGLTYAYLYPGSQALFANRTDFVMSDDTDGATMPYGYDTIIQTWHQHPSRLFYGTVYVDGTNPEHGVAHWMPWNERWTLLAASNFFVTEQLSTAVVFVLLILNALAMFALCRYLQWGRSLSFGLAIAWAFCAFTRARAKVHMAMSGTYHLPLIFLGLYLVTRGRGKRSLVAASAAFVLAMTVIHYFQVTNLFLSPLFLCFLCMQPETRENWRRVAKRMAIAIFPAVLFVGFNYAVPVPSDARVSREESFPTAGESKPGETHPFLLYFAARPLDYLGGDISLANRPDDSNPLREMANQYILTHLEGGNAHERSNGIRWSILALALVALIALARGKIAGTPKANILFFAIFAFVSFWLSLSPDFPFHHWGLSYWLHEMISQVRVPSRAGINVHFSLLMIVGFFLSSATKPDWRRYLCAAGVFPALMILDYPPFTQDMTMAAIRPAYTELQRDKGACGAGFYFPFINYFNTNTIYYYFIQRMRQSDCQVLNSMQTPARVQYMLNRFPPATEYLHHLPTDEATPRNLEQLVRCVPLTWIAFDPETPQTWREDMCRRLGWTMNPDLTCVAPNKGAPLQRFPDACG